MRIVRTLEAFEDILEKINTDLGEPFVLENTLVEGLTLPGISLRIRVSGCVFLNCTFKRSLTLYFNRGSGMTTIKNCNLKDLILYANSSVPKGECAINNSNVNGLFSTIKSLNLFNTNISYLFANQGCNICNCDVEEIMLYNRNLAMSSSIETGKTKSFSSNIGSVVLDDYGIVDEKALINIVNFSKHAKEVRMRNVVFSDLVLNGISFDKFVFGLCDVKRGRISNCDFSNCKNDSDCAYSLRVFDNQVLKDNNFGDASKTSTVDGAIKYKFSESSPEREIEP